MPKRNRTPANLEAERRYKQQRKRIQIYFHEEKDAEVLAWMRSQVSDDTEIPALIKAIVEQKAN